MAARRVIRRRYGDLKVFEASLVYENICMFTAQDPESIPDLILKCDAMLEKAFEYGRQSKGEDVSEAYQKFLESMG